MTAVDELVAFVRAQLDEDERMARAADAGRWLPEDKGITFEYRADDFHGGEAQARLVADTRANQWHIANWDPPRVLAEVEAKRHILEQLWDSDWGFTIAPETAERVMKLLAQPYAGRDGWREEWRL